MHPLLRSLAAELSATILRILAYIGGIAVIAVLAAKLLGTPRVEAAVEPLRSDWSHVERPYRAFALSIPEFAEREPDYAISRHARGGGRKDIMTWGKPWADPADAGSRLTVEVYRPGQERKRFADAASEVAAHTADLGGPYALKPGEAIDSKFGPVATFAFTARAGERRRHCLGFVHAAEEPRLQIAGWYCKGGAEVIDRGTLACALERLSLVMAASEPKVTELFARAELRRRPCGAKPKSAQRPSNIKRQDWIDAPKDPKLRGRVAGK
ncbi:MAG: hypothetical protein QOI12_4852 [Alphaproteobacteria bacterium]|nr:hypothetical protein [Alphaproteobacteria bacterium]